MGSSGRGRRTGVADGRPLAAASTMSAGPRIGAFVVAGDKRRGVGSAIMATPTAAGPGLEAATGLSMFQEVLQSLLHEGSPEETLTLISRRVTELAAFE